MGDEPSPHEVDGGGTGSFVNRKPVSVSDVLKTLEVFPLAQTFLFVHYSGRIALDFICLNRTNFYMDT